MWLGETIKVSSQNNIVRTVADDCIESPPATMFRLLDSKNGRNWSRKSYVLLQSSMWDRRKFDCPPEGTILPTRMLVGSNQFRWAKFELGLRLESRSASWSAILATECLPGNRALHPLVSRRAVWYNSF